MHALPHRWSATGHIAVRRLSAIALSISLIALLAAIIFGGSVVAVRALRRAPAEAKTREINIPRKGA